MAILTRAAKGRMLTHQELDSNFTQLDSKAGAAQTAADTAKSTADSAASAAAAKAAKDADNAFSAKQTFGKAVIQKSQALAGNDIDVSSSNHFKKTITAATTFTVSGVSPAGTISSFILDLINGGAFTVTWFAGIKWAAGTAPTLTASGRDSLGFYTDDGGATWTGVVIAKDAK